MTWNPSETVREKARRYLRQGKVRPDPGTVGVWWVTGTRKYRVQTDATPENPRMTYVVCSCDHGTRAGGWAVCSHAVAVALCIIDSIETSN